LVLDNLSFPHISTTKRWEFKNGSLQNLASRPIGGFWGARFLQFRGRLAAGVGIQPRQHLPGKRSFDRVPPINGQVKLVAFASITAPSWIAESLRQCIGGRRYRMASFSESPKRGVHYPALDGLRAAAILLVLVFHCLKMPPTETGRVLGLAIGSCWFGVDLFFVLSGFLITGILLDTRDHQNRWTVFVARRTLRVFPLYYFGLAVLFWLLPIFAPNRLRVPQDAEPWCWTYTFNVYVWSHQDWPANGVLNHFWSLAVEEQFYLLWPLVVFSVPARRLGGVCVGGIVLSIAFKVWLFARTPIGWQAIYTLAPCRMDALLGGGLVAWMVRFPQSVSIRVIYKRLSLVLIGVLCLLFSLQARFFAPVFDRFTVTFLTSFYALLFPWLLLYLVEKPRSLIHRILCWKPFAFIARLSYGMYISHFLVWTVLIGAGREGLMTIHQTMGIPLWVVAFALTTLLTVGISWVLYWAVESPMLSLKRLFPYETRPVTSSTPLYQPTLIAKND
jgi:peptidoglycan/LPS O-acetylase OafA/YrhL